MNTPSMYSDGSYLENNPTWHSEDSPWKAEQILKILKRNQLSPSSIGEVGCGAGEILVQLKDALGDGLECVGYELSEQAFQICQRKARPGLSFVKGDPFTAPPRTFDVMLVIDVIEHLEDYFTFVRNLKSRATYKLFHIPLDLSVQTVFREQPLVRGRASVGHIHYFAQEIALSMLRETGHEIVDHFITPGGIELPRKSMSTALARPLRRLLYTANPALAARLVGGFSLMVLAR